MVYFRVASQITQPPMWKWQSNVVTSFDALFLLLKTCKGIPKEHIRVFFSSSSEKMNDMLTRQNEGLVTNSLTATELLQGKKISEQDIARLELELESSGDHDMPYTFAPPVFAPETLAWSKLLAKVWNGELEP